MQDVVAFDLETNAQEIRSPFLHAYLCGIVHGNATFLYDDVRIALEELVWYKNAGYRVVGHNASRFDRCVLRALYGVDLKVDDTMLMAWLLDETRGDPRTGGLDLQTLAMIDLRVQAWKEMVEWDWRKPLEIPWDKAKEYCGTDTAHTLRLYEKYRSELQQGDGALWKVYDRLLLPASRALSDMEERGLYVSTANCDNATEFFSREVSEHSEIIATYAARFGLDTFNPASPKQVGELLYDHMQLPCSQRTRSGKPSTAVGPLKKLREQGYEPPLLNALFKRRKALRMVNTYTEKFKKLADCRSMIYPGYSLTSTDSGRVASFNPNAQNIPREPRVRRIIAAPPGKVLLAADYSQLEMRTAASKYVFDEPNLREAFLRGDDVHRLLAATITGKLPVDVTKVERTNAKPPNFLFLYGGEEQMYIDTLLDDYDIVKPFAEARRERDAYFTRWNQLPAGHAKYVDELLATGEVRSPLGTRRRIPHVFDLYPSARKEAFRVVINFVNQCFAAHLAQIGLVLLNAAGIDVRSFQHDAYLCYVDDNEEAVRSTARTMRDLLTRGVPQVLYDEFGLTLDVPLLVDVSAGTAWTDDDRLCEHDVWMPKLACPQCIEAAVWKHLDVGYTVAV